MAGQAGQAGPTPPGALVRLDARPPTPTITPSTVSTLQPRRLFFALGLTNTRSYIDSSYADAMCKG